MDRDDIYFFGINPFFIIRIIILSCNTQQKKALDRWKGILEKTCFRERELCEKSGIRYLVGESIEGRMLDLEIGVEFRLVRSA